MVKTKLAILIASFAFSTAAIASTAVPKDVGVGTTPDNIAPANCPLLAAASGGWNENRQADLNKAYAALKTQKAEVKKPAKQNTGF